MRGRFLTIHEASGTLKVGRYTLLVCCVTHFPPIFSTPSPLKELRTPRSSKSGQPLEGSQRRQKRTGRNLLLGLESHLLVKSMRSTQLVGLFPCFKSGYKRRVDHKVLYKTLLLAGWRWLQAHGLCIKLT